MNIKISLLEPGLVEQLRRWEQSKVDDLTPAMQRIGRFSKSQVQLGFRSGTSPYGAAWAPLALRSGQPLRDTGHLMGSINFVARDNRMAVGTNVQYAETHQYGAHIVALHAKALRFEVDGVVYYADDAVIPARPFLPTEGLPAGWQSHYVGALVDHLKGSIT